MLTSWVWEGYHKSKRCSRDTYPESYVIKYTSIRRLKIAWKRAQARQTGETNQTVVERERILIELMTSDRKLKASREGSKSRIYGT